MFHKGIAALAVVAMGWCTQAAAQVLEVSGATTVQRRVLEPGADALKGATGIQLKIYGPGTGKGMLALFDGKVPVAAAGESLEDAVASAKAAAAEADRTVSVPGNLVYHQVASDNIVVAVHANNPVKTLTRQQIKDLMIKGSPEKVHVVGGATIPRPLGFVTIGAPTPVAQKMIDYFRSPEGQKHIH